MSNSNAEKDQKDHWWRFDNPIMWAVLATALFGLLLVYLGRVPTCNIELFPEGDCPPKWRHIVAAPVNEVGDTLAGLAGVLAFIWLVATVMLQAHELSEQRKEIRDQRKATQDMARSMEAQALMLEGENRQRRELQSKELFEQLLSNFLDFCQSRSIGTWNFIETRSGMGSTKGSLRPVGFFDFGSLSVDRSMQVVGREIVGSKKQIFDFHERGLIIEYPEKDEDMEQALGMLSELENLRKNISAAQRSRFDSLGIREMKEALSSLASENELWVVHDEASQ